MPFDYAEQIKPYREKTEDLVALFETVKDKLAEDYAAQELDKSMKQATNALLTVRAIYALFAYRGRKRQNIKNPDFRKDQQLRRLVGNLDKRLIQMKEAIVNLSLKDFAHSADMAQVQVYRILTRCDVIEKEGINETPTQKKGVLQSLILKKDFEDWKKFTKKEKARKKLDDPDREELDPLDKLDLLFDELA